MVSCWLEALSNLEKEREASSERGEAYSVALLERRCVLRQEAIVHVVRGRVADETEAVGLDGVGLQGEESRAPSGGEGGARHTV